MGISFGTARLLRYVVASAAKFSESAVVYVSPDRFSFKAIDPSKSALLVLTIPREVALQYDVSSEQQLAVNLEDLAKVFRSAEKDDSVTINWTESSIEVSFERKGFSRVFTLPLASVFEEVPEIEVEYPNTYVVRPTELYEALNGLKDVGDVLRVEGDEDSVKLRAESELGEAEVTLSRERGSLEEAEVNQPGFSVAYTMELVQHIRQLVKLAERTSLRVGPELPLYLRMESHGCTIDYYVAPRAE